ncbi:MAG: twin-arginine translocase subunit TatC [Verrucomicrobiales bacterium]|nr:twin-arginine translocase subunit TatC [Verrucomicrobiales bacterium]
MADEREDHRVNEEEDGGGEVKSFLEHLEDLRWTLIKSGSALIIGMVICLFVVDKVVTILSWPLHRAALIHVTREQKVVVRLGVDDLFTFRATTNRIGPLDLGTNSLAVIQLDPVALGTNLVFSARLEEKVPGPETPAETGTALIYLDPAAPFTSSLRLAFFAGILLAAPFIFYFVGQFVMPALKIKEKKYFFRAFLIGLGLFIVGVSSCYFLLLPRALKYAELWALWMGVKVPDWRAETYFSFVTKFMLGMGLGFELPVVLLALVKIGVLDYQKLAAMRKYMIVINLLLGALLTTPEVFTQVMMAIPLQFLYECSVWIAWYWERQDKRREAALAAEEASSKSTSIL